MFNKLKNIITHTNIPDKSIIDLLTETTIGTNGAKYKHLHTKTKIHSLHKPHYISIRKNSKVIGNMTVCERPILINKINFNSFYVRYFAFDSLFQSKGKTTEKKRTSLFENYLQSLFSSSNINANTPENKPSMYWAFIDPENNRSWNMANRFGFETIGYFSTFAFSRFFPKKHKSVNRITITEQQNTWEQIKNFYKDHSNLSKTHLFTQNNYFVFKENNKVVAGVQVHKAHWEIENLPGIKGKLLLKTLPYIPFINRIINPKNYRFLAIEGLYWEKGHSDKIEPLLESVLAEINCHSMLMWIDNGDENLINQFNTMELGVLQKLKSDNSIEIVAKFNNFDEQLKNNVIHSLKYISGFDTT